MIADLHAPIDEQEVYDYYTHNLLPALRSSLPILLARLANDAASLSRSCAAKFIQFLFPIWFRRWTADTTDTLARAARVVSTLSTSAANSTFVDFILEKLDLNHDGRLSTAEWSGNAEEMKREVEALIHQYYHAVAESLHDPRDASWYDFLRTSISRCLSLDWSIGAYIWSTCSGLILVLVVTSIVPGRLHGWTGRALRFPILGVTYLLIAIELVMYALVRLAIRALEGIFATAKHRAWRKGMTRAQTYEEWYDIAKRLDDSQGREKWRNNVDDDTAYRYSWPFILEMMTELRSHREDNNLLMAMAVLQQCTRKNVGGIMSDDLFSFTNCGEPKQVVSEFIDEVVDTLQWVTEEVRDISRDAPPDVAREVAEERAECPEARLETSRERKSKEEEGTSTKLEPKGEADNSKILDQMVAWATLGILGGSREDNKGKTGEENKGKADTDQDASSTVPVDHVRMASITSDARRDTHEEDAHNLVRHAEYAKDLVRHEEYAKKLVLRGKIKTFLKRAKSAYGRTALCLSGGAMMGCYHFGAVKALLETDLLPHIISGTSAGSVIGAMICTRTEDELQRDLRPEVLAPKMSIFESSWGQRLTRWYRHGTMFDRDDWYRRVMWFTCDDMTFEEAYKKTGRVLCVTLSATSKKAPPVLINYITAPDVVIASAVLASAAVPGFVDAVKLQVKDENGVVRDQSKCDEEYRDGSIDSDIPTNGLAEMLNCRFFLAAQANPHIVPFFYNSKGDVGRPSRWSSGVRDDSWRGGFLLSAIEMYLKNDMKSKFHFLNDLEVAVGFTSTMMTQVYSGTTTIVPQVCLRDFLLLFAEQPADDMRRYFQGGSVAAYQHVAMLKLHYKIAHALDECLACLDLDESPSEPPQGRRSALALGSLHFTKLEPRGSGVTSSASTVSDGLSDDEEHEKEGLDRVECEFLPG